MEDVKGRAHRRSLGQQRHNKVKNSDRRINFHPRGQNGLISPRGDRNTWRTKRRAHRQGLEQLHNKEKKSDRRATRASSDAGPELAGREGHAAMESPQALIAPLERGSGELKRNARSVRGCDRVTMKKQDQGGKSSLGQPCCPIAAFYRGSMYRNLQVVINQAFKQNQSYGFGNSENA